MGALRVRVHRAIVDGRLTTPKSRSSERSVPLASRLVAELDVNHRRSPYNGDDDLVFAHPHTGRPLDDTRLRRRWRAALERADVRPVGLHGLRHTFATTIAASAEASLRTLQEWMGHTEARTTQIYAAYLPSEREQQQLDRAFRRQSGGQSVASFAHTAPPQASGAPDNTAYPQEAA